MNVCRLCVWDQSERYTSGICMVSLCGISSYKKYVAGACVVYVCGISV